MKTRKRLGVYAAAMVLVLAGFVHGVEQNFGQILSDNSDITYDTVTTVWNFSKLSVTGAASFADGAAATPSITNTGDLNTGIWFPAADTVAISTAGAEAVRVDAAGALVVATSLDIGNIVVQTGSSRKVYRQAADTDVARGDALAAAFTASSANDTITIGPGAYSISATLSVLEGQTVVLEGSQITSTDNSVAMFTADGVSDWQIRGNGLLTGAGAAAGGAYTDERGIAVIGGVGKVCSNWQIEGLSFTNFRGCAIYCDGTTGTYPYDKGGRMSKCHIYANGYGIYLASVDANNAAYYCVIDSCNINSNNNYGVYVMGGNNVVQGCTITSNAGGIYLGAGFNHGHGVISACELNHNTVAGIYADSITNGETIADCHIIANAIGVYLNATKGVNISGGMIYSNGTDDITLNGVFTGFNRVTNVWTNTSAGGAADLQITGTAAQKVYLLVAGNNTDDEGSFVFGHSKSLDVYATHKVQINSASAYPLSCTAWSNDTSGNRIMLAKSRSTVPGTYSTVANGDQLGALYFLADDGTDLNSFGAVINAVIDGTPGPNDIPTYLSFGTTADGAAAATERLRLDSRGSGGLGVIPKVWHGNYRALQVGQSGVLMSNAVGVLSTYLADNWYVDAAAAHRRIAAGYVSQIAFASGTQVFRVAGTDAADSVITWTTAMTIANDGDVTGGTAGSWALQNVAASSTVPTICPDSAGVATGFGGDANTAVYGIVNSASLWRLTAAGVAINNPTANGNLAGGLTFKNGTAASAAVTDGVQLWAADAGGLAGHSGLHMRGEDDAANLVVVGYKAESASSDTGPVAAATPGTICNFTDSVGGEGTGIYILALDGTTWNKLN